MIDIAFLHMAHALQCSIAWFSAKIELIQTNGRTQHELGKDC